MSAISKHISADSPPVRQGLNPDQVIELLNGHPDTRGLAITYRLVAKLAAACAGRGGRLYVLGGAVRDEVLGVIPRDFDLEAHGLSQDQVIDIAGQLGDPRDVGKSFGTILLQTQAGKIDIALPRRDSKTGDGHRDFAVDVIPHLGLRGAARRRDFTIGTIYKDVLDGSIFDPFNGIADLKAKILRLVDPATFADDALRVLRGAAHVARLGLTVDPATKQVMGTMVEKMGLLPKPRWREEWTKLLVQGREPSGGLQLLLDVGVLSRWFPELAKLWSTPQDPKLHPEGNVGVHTMMVVDAASALTWDPPNRNQRREIMLAALLHDVGKPATTTTDKHGRVRSIGHEAAGAKPAENFLTAIGFSPAEISRLVPLVVHHLRPAELYRERRTITDRALRKLGRDISPHWIRALVTLAEADHRGRGPFTLEDGSVKMPDTAGYHAWWEEQIDRLQLDQFPEPILSGHDLVVDRQSQGWKTGPLIGQAIHVGQELAIDGMTRPEILTIVDQAASPEAAVAELGKRLPPDN